MSFIIFVLVCLAAPVGFLVYEQRKKKKYLITLNSVRLEEKILRLEINSQQTVSQNDAIYWYFKKLTRESERANEKFQIDQLYEELLSRLNPDDLIELARSNLDDHIPMEKISYIRLVTALKELADRGEWGHLSYVLPPLAQRMFNLRRESGINPDIYYLDQYAQKSIAHQEAHFQMLYCKEHMHRFHRVRNKKFIYGVCRKCQGSQYGIQIEKSTLVLNHSVSWKMHRKGPSFWINGLLIEEPCDFDAIVVGPCREEKIERFCILIGNDSDADRVEGYQRIEYRMLKGTEITEKGLALLDRFFVRKGNILMK